MEGQPGEEQSRFEGVREALRRDAAAWFVSHIDITCDGCEVEPITGHRFKCTVCEDIDLCERCMRALVAARLKMAAGAGPLHPAAQKQGQGRPRRWVAKLHSRHTSERWAALQQVVPCLHPSHRFAKVLEGPEREVVFVGSQLRGRQEAQQQEGAQQRGGGAVSSAVSSSGGSCSENLEIAERQTDASELASGMSRLAVGAKALPCGRQHADADPSGGASPSVRSSAGSSCAQPCSGGGGGARSQNGACAGPPHGTGGGSSSSSLAAELEDFLKTFPPSRACCHDLAWINVMGLPGKGGAGRPGKDQISGGGLEERVEQALEDWEELTAPGRPPPTSADIDALARRHRLLAGKWMAFPQRGAEADAAWAAVARAAVAGELGPQAKISSVDPAKPDHVICVYTSNYLDVDDVQRVRAALARVLPSLRSRRLLYKADVYTYLGLYAGNEYNLRPTVYSATL